MKVLSNHVSKSLSDGGMDSFIMVPSTGHVKSDHKISPQSNKTSPANILSSENINQKRWRNIMRKIQKKDRKSALFGQPLSRVFVDKNTPPKAVTEILRLLCKNGTGTEGVFRRAGNARIMKEIKEQLNTGVEVDFTDKPVLLLAALLKDFIREIPGGLLMEKLYKSWMAAMATCDIAERCSALQKVIEQLPEENILLLRHLSFMLYIISQNADQNKMNPRNLAVCMAPNLVHMDMDQLEAVGKVTDLTEFLIENYCEVFGEKIQHLLDDSDEEELNDSQDSLSPLQHDSAYETDADGEKSCCALLGSSLDESLISETFAPAKETCSNTFTRPFIRRCSEPLISLPRSVRVQPPLTRSHTASLLRMEDEGCCCQSMQLRKQISDECIVPKSWRSLDSSLAHGQRCLPSSASESCPCGSSRSLESAFSSASESSVFANSPPASPSCLRRSSPCEALPAPSPYSQPQEHQERRESTLQRRSQSMRYAATHNRAALRRGGSSRITRNKRTLPSCALPEDMEVLRKPLTLSTAEVFHLVDSRIPGLPPPYEQATQSTPFPCSSPPRHSMTVQEARRLSAQKDPALTTHPTDVLNDPVTNTVTSGLDSAPPAVSTTVCRTRSISESYFKPPAKSLLRRCSQPLFEELMHAQESYV